MGMGADGASWSVAEAAGLLSGLSAVIAGFAFTGVTVVLMRPTEGCDSTSRHLARWAIGELLPGAVVSGVAALEWAILAGETNPALLRDEAAAVFAAITLVTGSVQLLVGLCYLVVDFDRGALMTLCMSTYRSYAVLSAFSVTWVGTDVVGLGFGGGPRPTAMWSGRLLPVAAAALVAVALAPHQPPHQPPGRSSWTAVQEAGVRWLSARRGPGLVAGGAVASFGATILLADEGSRLSRSGGWSADPTVLLYCGLLLVMVVAVLVTLVLQGWILGQRSRSSP